jgi:aryl-alcohol dehydrogenase-like predicted oxidoreductase
VQLGIGVFGSGPLLEAALLKDAKLTSTLQSVPQLRDVEDTAPRLLQLARSSPGLLTALVGHKAPKHVRQNGDLAQVPPLDDAAFQAALKALRA